jgi:hypothetical protein|tara:strand:- start:891 stop:1277 length:387 start_codon:yes stop_codon:yes gene_type:complete
MENIVIEQSGILQALNCSVNDIRNSFSLYRKGFVTENMRKVDYSSIQDFIKMLFQIGCLKSANRVFEKAAIEADKYMFDIQVKKSAGTYNEWLEEITEQNKEFEPFIKRFFDEFKKRQPPINLSNGFN